MRKVRLDVEALEVESFEVDGRVDARRGTVAGRAVLEGSWVEPIATLVSPLGCVVSVAGCSIGWTCPDSCGITCGHTCAILCTDGYSCGGGCEDSNNCSQISYCAA